MKLSAWLTISAYAVASNVLFGYPDRFTTPPVCAQVAETRARKARITVLEQCILALSFKKMDSSLSYHRERCLSCSPGSTRRAFVSSHGEA